MLDPRANDVDLAARVADFARDGFARIGRVASDETLAALRARADDLMLARNGVDVATFFYQHDAETLKYEDLRFGEGYRGPSLEYRKIEKLERDATFRAWIENPLFARIARAVVGPEVALYRAILMTKGARGGTDLPWHQDGGSFWGLDRPPVLQIWTALDDAPIESGCVEAVPGTHDALATPLGGVVPRPIADARGAESKAVALPVSAGDVLLIHNYVWHRSGANRTGRTRRAFSVSYIDAATRCLRKKRAPREFLRLFAR